MQEAQELTTDLPERRATGDGLEFQCLAMAARHDNRGRWRGLPGHDAKNAISSARRRRHDISGGPERADAYHSKSLLATLPCMANAVRLRPEIERCQESGREKTEILKKVFTGTLRVCRGWSGRDARAPRERRSGPRETVAQKRPMKTRVMFYAGNCQKRRRDCGGAQPAHWPLCASPVSPPRGGETFPAGGNAPGNGTT